VRAAYLDRATRDPGRIRVIDSTRSLAEVRDAVARELATLGVA
jgi:dTMP kinase